MEALDLNETQKVVSVSVTTVVRQIEALYGSCLLKPEVGLYIKHGTGSVVIKPTVMYYQYMPNSTMVKNYGSDFMADKTLMKNDIFTGHDKLVLKRGLIPLLTPTPGQSARVSEMVYELVDKQLRDHFAFNKTGRSSWKAFIRATLLENIDPEFLPERDDDIEFNNTLDTMTDVVDDVYSQVYTIISAFMDGDTYHQHIARVSGDTVVIYKLSDYRIMVFNEMLSKGELDIKNRYSNQLPEYVITTPVEDTSDIEIFGGPKHKER